MKLCSILPIDYIGLDKNRPYSMLLAHLSMKHPKYREYYKANSNYKIMDNSIIEMGSAFSIEKLIHEAEECDVQEIILPDAFEDGNTTFSLVTDSILYLKEHNLIGKFKLMAVCHGRHLDEFLRNFKRLSEIPEIDTIGIPKVTCKWIGTRAWLGFSDIIMNCNKEIHLLGCWSSLLEFIEMADTPFFNKIRSADTCLPALLSRDGITNIVEDRKGNTLNLEFDSIYIPTYLEIMKELEKYHL